MVGYLAVSCPAVALRGLKALFLLAYSPHLRSELPLSTIAVGKQSTLRRATSERLKQLSRAKAASIVIRQGMPAQVQKLTDGFIKDVDSMCEQKEAELQRV